MADEYLNAMHRSTRQIYNISCELRDLSEAFWKVGNKDMSDILGNISNELCDIEKEINNAVSKEITRELRVSQEQTKTMIDAVFSGIFLGKKESENELR